MSDTYEFAHCWRTGEIEFSPKPAIPGLILIDEGPSQVMRARVSALARQSHVDGVYLVPGVPEAETDDDAETALYAFHQKVAHRRLYPHD